MNHIYVLIVLKALNKLTLKLTYRMVKYMHIFKDTLSWIQQSQNFVLRDKKLLNKTTIHFFLFCLTEFYRFYFFIVSFLWEIYLDLQLCVMFLLWEKWIMRWKLFITWKKKAKKTETATWSCQNKFFLVNNESFDLASGFRVV